MGLLGHLRFGLAVVVLSAPMLACKPAASPASPSAAPSSSPPAGEVTRAGAWSQADPYAPEVQEAARFAVQTFAVQNKARVLFKEVILARQQVVAGTQFELRLEVTLDGTTRTSQAVVWRQLDGTYKLQAWDWLV